MSKKILVTGGTGYIGSHTVVELINEGYDVVVLDNLCNSKIEAIEGIQKITGKKPVFEKVELCNKTEVSNFFKKHPDIDAIIHFAAFKAVGESVAQPLYYYENNMFSMINLMNAINELKKEVFFVFSSSCAVYGDSDVMPVHENLALKEATSPYGITKQMAERIIRDTLTINKNIQTISLRYFNPIGAHSSGFIGETPLKTYNLIPILTETATGKRKEMQIFGNDYETHDGTAVRDYIHVVDLAKAHIIALNRLLNRKNESNFETFNLGIGKGYSVLDMISMFEKVSGKKINFKIVGRRIGDVPVVYSSTTKANTVLQWKAVLELEEMLLSAWKWESEFRWF